MKGYRKGHDLKNGAEVKQVCVFFFPGLKILVCQLGATQQKNIGEDSD